MYLWDIVKNIFLIFLLVLSIVSCQKADIAIGLEGTYEVEVSNHVTSYLGTKDDYDHVVHGLYVNGSDSSNVPYTIELKFFKQQGKCYVEREIYSSNGVDYSCHLPLNVSDGKITFSSPLGNNINGCYRNFFMIQFDKTTLKGKWILGEDTRTGPGSISSVENGKITESSISLKKV